MRARRLSITVPAAVAVGAQEAARRQGTTLSRWVGHAMELRLKQEAARELLAEWEATHGPFTEEELAQARAGLPT